MTEVSKTAGAAARGAHLLRALPGLQMLRQCEREDLGPDVSPRTAGVDRVPQSASAPPAGA